MQLTARPAMPAATVSELRATLSALSLDSRGNKDTLKRRLLNARKHATASQERERAATGADVGAGGLDSGTARTTSDHVDPPRPEPRARRPPGQQFDSFLVFDVEATCERIDEPWGRLAFACVAPLRPLQSNVRNLSHLSRTYRNEQLSERDHRMARHPPPVAAAVGRRVGSRQSRRVPLVRQAGVGARHLALLHRAHGNHSSKLRHRREERHGHSLRTRSSSGARPTSRWRRLSRTCAATFIATSSYDITYSRLRTGPLGSPTVPGVSPAFTVAFPLPSDLELTLSVNFADLRDFVSKTCYLSNTARPDWLAGEIIDLRLLAGGFFSRLKKEKKERRRAGPESPSPSPPPPARDPDLSGDQATDGAQDPAVDGPTALELPAVASVSLPPHLLASLSPSPAPDGPPPAPPPALSPSYLPSHLLTAPATLSLPSVLLALTLPAFEGRLHSGLADARNASRILTDLARRGVLLETNRRVPEGGRGRERRWGWMEPGRRHGMGVELGKVKERWEEHVRKEQARAAMADAAVV